MAKICSYFAAIFDAQWRVVL